MNISNWLEQNTESLKGKTVAITGSTGGLGKEICKYLALLSANLILLDRNRTKSENLGRILTEMYPEISVKYVTLDLTDIDSVKVVCDILKNLNIDVLILNAGAYNITRYKCSTGYDNIFQINFISQYYLCQRLLSESAGKTYKVIAVNSIAHLISKINTKDPQLLSCRNSEKVYGNAKRFMLYALFDLFKNNDFNLSVVHPGITYTNMMTNYPKFISSIIKYPMKKLFISPSTAALCVIKGIFTKCNNLEWIGPAFLGIWGLPRKSKLKEVSSDEEKCILQFTSEVVKL